MKISSRFFIALMVLVLSSCNQILCGELESGLKERVEMATKVADGKFELEIIPCEFRMINLHSKQRKVDYLIIPEIHMILYDSTTNEGWCEIVIFDIEGHYAGGHHCAEWEKVYWNKHNY